MIEMLTLRDYVTMLGLAAVFGALGGLVGQLMARQQAMMMQQAMMPSMPPKGGVANLLVGTLVGAAAAVIALYFLAPITTQANAYDFIRLVASSLVVGTAGSTFITAAQMQLLMAVKEQKIQTMEAKMQTMELEAKMQTMEGEMAAKDAKIQIMEMEAKIRNTAGPPALAARSRLGCLTWQRRT